MLVAAVVFIFFLMTRRPPRSTRTYTRCPYTTLGRAPIFLPSAAGTTVAGPGSSGLANDGDRPGPARRCSANLDGEACDHEAGRGQGFQIVQFFEVAVADVAAGLVALPNDRSVVVGLITGRSEEHTSELPSLMRFAYGVF